MGKIVYWASSLHNDIICSENEMYARYLRSGGHTPKLPQWSGVWEDMLKDELRKGHSLVNAKRLVKKQCFERDKRDMDAAQACIVYAPIVPSEGTCFELGYMYANKKPCCLFVPSDYVYDLINLMLTHAAPRFSNFDDVLQWCNEIDINMAAETAGKHLSIFGIGEGNPYEYIPKSLRNITRDSGEEAICNAKRWVDKNTGYAWAWV